MDIAAVDVAHCLEAQMNADLLVFIGFQHFLHVLPLLGHDAVNVHPTVLGREHYAGPVVVGFKGSFEGPEWNGVPLGYMGNQTHSISSLAIGLSEDEVFLGASRQEVVLD